MRHLATALLTGAALAALPLGGAAFAASPEGSVTLQRCVEAGGQLGMGPAGPSEFVCVGGPFDGSWIATFGP